MTKQERFNYLRRVVGRSGRFTPTETWQEFLSLGRELAARDRKVRAAQRPLPLEDS